MARKSDEPGLLFTSRTAASSCGGMGLRLVDWQTGQQLCGCPSKVGLKSAAKHALQQAGESWFDAAIEHRVSRQAA